MGEQSLGRRQVLRGAGVVAAGGAAVTAVTGLGLASPAMASDDDGGGLTGSWMVTRQDDGDPTQVQAVFSFAGGGVFVEHDILPAGPPFTGTWARRDGGRFRATFLVRLPGGRWPRLPRGHGQGASGGTCRTPRDLRYLHDRGLRLDRRADRLGHRPVQRAPHQRLTGKPATLRLTTGHPAAVRPAG